MSEIARKLAEILVRLRPRGVASAWLFGSHAEGRAHRESDIDVGVVADRKALPSARERHELRVMLGSELIRELSFNEVNVVMLDDAAVELGCKAVTRGIRVYCALPEVDHAFVRDVQLRWGDLGPWLLRMRRIKLEALKR